MHQKRKSIPKSWPIARKGTAYVMAPKSSHSLGHSLSLLVIIRDILHLAKNAAEAKAIIKTGEIEVNNKKIIDEKYGPGLLDIIHIKKLKKTYIMTITEGGKLSLKEIENTKFKISKVIGKRIINKKQMQINLMDGRNFLVKEKINTDDSILIDLEKKAISKVLPLKKDSQIFIIKGKWQGRFSKIHEIKDSNVEITVNDKKTTIPIKNIIVIEQKW
jgi:small subunit ribosomal protein S4e